MKRKQRADDRRRVEAKLATLEPQDKCHTQRGSGAGRERRGSLLSSLVLTSVFGVEAVKEVGGGVAVAAAGQVVGAAAAAAAAHAAGRLDVAHAAGRLDVDAVLLLDAVGLTVPAAANAARVRGRAAVAAAQVVRRVVAARRRRVSRA